MSKKDHQTKHIGNAIRDMLDRYSLAGRFNEANVIASWERLVGKPVARRTRKLYIRDKVLFVHMESASTKHDLTFLKAGILKSLETEFGKGVVEEIVLM
jgi:predicted nucleic acid-binding Zn ribbon protein